MYALKDILPQSAYPSTYWNDFDGHSWISSGDTLQIEDEFTGVLVTGIAMSAPVPTPYKDESPSITRVAVKVSDFGMPSDTNWHLEYWKVEDCLPFINHQVSIP